MSSHDATLVEATSASQPAAGRPGVAPGERIGRYLVIGKLGEGGMGVVYSAYDPELDRKIAIKLLHGSPPRLPTMDRARGNVMQALFGDDEADDDAEPVLSASQQRLLREAQAAARVNDPSVVTVHDVGQYLGRVFVAMEFVQGRTLSAWSRERARGWREVIDVMTRAGAGLVAAHAAGLIHRDFKPDNVMLGDDARIRVMDFGLVRADASESSGDATLRPTTDALALELTVGGTTMGTPAYMSPEQHRGKKLDARSDQFSFCVALWEALYGERPYAGASIPSIATAILEGQRRSPPDRGVPPAIHRIVVRGLATDPADRWPSMRELVAALRRDPLRTRNRIAIAIGVLAVAGGGFGFTRAQHAGAVAACRADAAAIREVWNADTRATLEQKLQGTAVSYAAASSVTIARLLDAHAEHWATATEAVCLAELEPATSPYPRDANACLAEHRADLRSAVETLAGVDATTMRGAVGVATSLTRPDECLDAGAAALRALQSGDRSPELLATARGRLRDARRLAALGRLEDATRMLEAILDEAATQPAIVIAWTKLALGDVAERRGDYAAAEGLLVEAAFEAEAVGDESSVMKAAIELVWVIGYRSGRPDDAAHWIRWAQVLVERLGVGQSLQGASLLERHGMVEASRQAHADALAKLEGALAIKRAQLGPDHPEVALVLNGVGHVKMELEGPAAAQPIWEEALAILEAALGQTHPDLGVVLSNLAQVQYRLGDFDAAQALIERAIDIRRAELGKDHPEVARMLANLGTILQTKGDFDAARTVLVEAKRVLERTHGRAHRSIGVLAQQLGKVEIAAGNLDAGIAILEDGLAILNEVLAPDHVDIAVGLSALGSAYERRGELERARELYERALAICMKHGTDGHPVFTPTALYQVGNVYRLQGDLDLAVEHLERAVQRFEAMQPASIDTATARFSLAQSLPPAQAARARDLVAAARAAFVEHDARAQLAELDAWSAAHLRRGDGPFP